MSDIIDITWPEWTVGDRIRKARRHAGLSQDQLAQRINTTQASLGAWELDYQRPRQFPTIAAKIALATGVDRDFLLGRDPEFCSECPHCAAAGHADVRLPLEEFGGVTVHEYLSNGGDPERVLALVRLTIADAVGAPLVSSSGSSGAGTPAAALYPPWDSNPEPADPGGAPLAEVIAGVEWGGRRLVA